MFSPERIKARDLMQTDLVQLSVSTPIDGAVETFEDYEISGAPVVNEAGELVGVLSVSDIVKAEHLRGAEIEDQRGEYYFNDPLDDGEAMDFSREDYSPAVLGRETVGDWMTPRVISVPPEATLSELCRLMAKERIHRVFVVKNGKPVGVVSSFDVVRYLSENS